MVALFVAVSHSSQVQALAKFSTSYQINYNVFPTGSTHVKFLINQKNNLSVVYATDFSLSVNHTKISNVRVFDENISIPADVTKSRNQTSITFSFHNKVVGKDKNHFFSVEYDTEDVTTKFGNTWQINIPKLEPDENLVEQNIVLTIPPSFPKPAYIDPKPSVVVNNVYYFSGNTLGNKPIGAVFGQTQYFKANLTYHLVNDLDVKVEKSIAIPPDTNYQKVYIESIDPKPEKFTEDEDGNLLAYYNLKPHEQIDISVSEIIRLNFHPESDIQSQNDKYLANNEIWDFESNIFTIPEVKNLTTAKSIYDYVSDKFTYDYQKVNIAKTQNISASESFKNPTSAICTDFTNVFVALARKVGIPARELQGYAISENPDLKPLSLTQDVLHAWPEYYNKDTGTWTQIDPTWSNTTHGVDYFNKLDLNHIVFVIHGTNPLSPIPAGGYKNGNKSKDLEIVPIDAIDMPQPVISVEDITQKDNNIVFTLKNESGTGYKGDITINNSSYLEDLTQTIKISPFSQISINQPIKSRPLIKPRSVNTIIYINGQQYENKINIQPYIPTFGIFTAGAVILGAIAFATRNIYLRGRK